MNKYRTIIFQCFCFTLKQMEATVPVLLQRTWPPLNLFIFLSRSTKEIHIITSDKSVWSNRGYELCVFFFYVFRSLGWRSLWLSSQRKYSCGNTLGKQSGKMLLKAPVETSAPLVLLLNPLKQIPCLSQEISCILNMLFFYIFKMHALFKWGNQISMSCCE